MMMMIHVYVYVMHTMMYMYQLYMGPSESECLSFFFFLQKKTSSSTKSSPAVSIPSGNRAHAVSFWGHTVLSPSSYPFYFFTFLIKTCGTSESFLSTPHYRTLPGTLSPRCAPVSKMSLRAVLLATQKEWLQRLIFLELEVWKVVDSGSKIQTSCLWVLHYAAVIWKSTGLHVNKTVL